MPVQEMLLLSERKRKLCYFIYRLESYIIQRIQRENQRRTGREEGGTKSIAGHRGRELAGEERTWRHRVEEETE